MRSIPLRPFLPLFLLLAALLAACESGPPEITITEPWGRTSIRAAANSAFYMSIQNDGGTEDALIAASADACRAVELHETTLDDQDVMTMRQVEEIVIPAGQSVKLEPGGLHIMCLDRSEEFVDGDLLPLTLTFELSGDQTVSLEIRQ